MSVSPKHSYPNYNWVGKSNTKLCPLLGPVRCQVAPEDPYLNDIREGKINTEITTLYQSLEPE